MAGASGIGYQISKQLVLNGASAVVIVSRTAAKAQQAINDIRKETGLEDAPLGFVECDFKYLTTLTQGWKISKHQFDTLINCAGITQTQGLLTTSPATVSEILKVNLEVPIELSRQMLKQYFMYGKSLSKDTTGDSSRSSSFCVVNVSSLLAGRSGYGTSIYSTSKAGLTAFTRTLALEAAAIRDKFPALPPFRANVVVPGYIDTPMIEKFSNAQKDKLVAEIPLRRYGKAEEVADAVMFLLKNEYANNTVLNLDGGLSAV
ncbi:hypothetical protein OHC33_007765 [Knufia fluminis]|uniref:Uncharacterized protein n=1 Tax=Knufia fluminis TaxID=191047 RepID=A0AAN8I2J2_9EURO|nr:hypothetical protein OHC33_007765 [Knufia fluminis]